MFVYAVLGFINTSTNPHSIVRYQLSFLLIVLVELIALTGYGKIKSEPEKIIANKFFRILKIFYFHIRGKNNVFYSYYNEIVEIFI